MVGSLLLVLLITSMSGWGKGASGPVGKESTFPGHLLLAGLPIFFFFSLFTASAELTWCFQWDFHLIWYRKSLFELLSVTKLGVRKR